MSQSESKLQQELLGDAELRAEQVLNRARGDAAKALAAVRDEQAKERETRLRDARREAEARAHAITARIRHEVHRRWIRLREQGLERLFADVLPRLEQGQDIDRERSLQQLLQEALEAMGPRAARVRLNPESAAVLTLAALAEVRSQAWPQADPSASLSLVVDSSLRPGLRLESADDRFVFDNTYATRLERLRGPLRSLVSAGMTSAESDDDGHA